MAQQSFLQPTFFKPGPGLRDWQGGDFNGDGLLDILTVHANTSIEVYLANSTGSYNLVSTQPVTQGEVVPVHTGDFTNDGLPDFTIIRAWPVNNIECYVSKGTGFFETVPIVTSNTQQGYLLRSVDFDGDGNLDLFTLASPPAVHPGLGNGSFLPGSYISFPGVSGFCGPNDRSLLFLDPNLDGLLDAVRAATISCYGGSSSSRIDISRNLGGFTTIPGGFYNSGTSALLPAPAAAASADMDGDGIEEIDAQVATFLGSPTSVDLKISNSLALSPVTICLSPFQGSEGNFTIGDVDLDGQPESLYISNTGLEIIKKSGSCFTLGTFPKGTGIPRIGKCDLNSDQLTDYVVSYSGSNEIWIFTHKSPNAPGAVKIGNGNAGCSGQELLYLTGFPKNGITFGFSAFNAPRNSLGMLLTSTIPDFAGSDPFGVGLVLYLNFGAAALTAGKDFPTDAFGFANYDIKLPLSPSLKGLKFYSQAIFQWPSGSCTLPTSFQLSSTNAIEVTIQ